MKLTNLYARADKYQDTINLIESEFGYSEDNSFETDFYPLIKEENRDNLFILLNDYDEVVAHTGILNKAFKIGAKTFKCNFIGGVVVKSDHQGKGLSRQLMEHVKDICREGAFSLLWSDKTDYYSKFDFYPCINQNQYEQTACHNSYSQVEVDDELIDSIKGLYNNPLEYRPIRSDQDWKDIQKISSLSVYIKGSKSAPENYFFINKGQDLSSIIHEYGKFDEEMLNYGNLWSPIEIASLSPTYQYATLLRIDNIDRFKEFVLSYSQNLIKLNEIDQYQASFQFGADLYNQKIEDFLTGLLGPSRYDELNDLKNIFIPGIDSI